MGGGFFFLLRAVLCLSDSVLPYAGAYVGRCAAYAYSNGDNNSYMYIEYIYTQVYLYDDVCIYVYVYCIYLSSWDSLVALAHHSQTIIYMLDYLIGTVYFYIYVLQLLS